MKTVTVLRAGGFSMRAAATMLGVGYTTLKNSFNREPALREAWIRGKYLATATLRIKLHEKALAGDVTLLKLLARHTLGMK